MASTAARSRTWGRSEGASDSVRESIVSGAWAPFSAALIQGNSQGLRDRMTGPQYPLLSPPRTRGSSPAAALEEPLAPSSLDPRFRGGDTGKRPNSRRRPALRSAAAGVIFGSEFHDFKGFRRHFGSFAHVSIQRTRAALNRAFTFPHGNIVRCNLLYVSGMQNHCDIDLRFSQENVDSCVGSTRYVPLRSRTTHAAAAGSLRRDPDRANFPYFRTKSGELGKLHHRRPALKAMTCRRRERREASIS